jgi:hypothetical protein
MHPVGYTTPARQSWFDDAVYERYALSGDWQLEDNASPVKRLRHGQRNCHWRQPDCHRCLSAPRQQSIALLVGSRRQFHAQPRCQRHRRYVSSVAWHSGRRCASGSAFALSGTSVATPHVVRWIAGEIAKPANRSGFDAASFIRNLATQNEHTLAASGFPVLPAERSGQAAYRSIQTLSGTWDKGKLKPESSPEQNLLARISDPDAQDSMRGLFFDQSGHMLIDLCTAQAGFLVRRRQRLGYKE